MPVVHQVGGRAALALRALLCLALLAALAACASGHRGGRYGGSSGGYAPPGPPEDPWGPYIKEAASRFSVPENWIREVMHQESGGNQYLGGGLTTSGAGAMGLMQVMPSTYAELAARHGLGGDPYDPHDNIMAGTAYIREMYDRYGAPNFLAAYNAGPRRVDQYLAGTSRLPAETVSYVAAIGPRLNGTGGPRTAYAAAAPAGLGRVQVLDAMAPIASPGDPGVPAASPAILARMDPIASAGDPGVPVAASVQVASMAPIASPGDPGMPAPAPLRPLPAAASGEPPVPPIVEAVARAPLGAPLPTVLARLRASPSSSRSPPPGVLALPARYAAAPAVAGSGGYGVQVGAFASPAEARAAADAARSAAGGGAQTSVGQVARSNGGGPLYRARLIGLSPESAAGACRRIQAAGHPCFVVPPEGAS